MLDNAMCKNLLKAMYGGIENPVIPTCQKAEAQELQVQSQLGKVVSHDKSKSRAGIAQRWSPCLACVTWHQAPLPKQKMK